MNTPTPSLADAPSIGEEELHRQRVPLAKRAEEKYSGAGWKVYQLWREFNKQLFGRQMSHCKIRFGSLGGKPFGRWEGGEIVLDRSLLRRDGKRWWLCHEQLGSHFPRDVLLRHMAVQYLTEVRGTDLSGPIERLFRSLPWIREINRLSAKMELEWRAVWAPEEKERASSAEILADETYWPYSARPERYYEADWRAIVEEKEGNGM